jgi:hypothetical protein
MTACKRCGERARTWICAKCRKEERRTEPAYPTVTWGVNPIEPVITINKTQLTDTQARTLRVALSSFESWLHEHPKGYGGDAHGVAMVRAYKERLAEISELVYGKGTRK